MGLRPRTLVNMKKKVGLGFFQCSCSQLLLPEGTLIQTQTC